MIKQLQEAWPVLEASVFFGLCGFVIALCVLAIVAIVERKDK